MMNDGEICACFLSFSFSFWLAVNQMVDALSLSLIYNVLLFSFSVSNQHWWYSDSLYVSQEKFCYYKKGTAESRRRIELTNL